MIEPSRRSALALLTGLFGLLVYWSFGKWTDPVIDFGFELYVPWRLSEGDVLYRDIAYRNGPLSSYWNALLFSAFGVSIRTLVVSNLLTLFATSALLFSLLERLSTRYAAALATGLFLAVCAFSQYGNVGNYNFVTPYQHGQTHGLWLGLCTVGLLERGLRRRRRDSWIGAGILLGALLLIKAEVFVPAAAASALAILLVGRGERFGASALLATGAVLLPVFAFVALSSSMSFADSLLAIAGNWPYLAGAFVSDGFYAAGAGLDEPTSNLVRMAIASAAIAALGAATYGAERFAPRLGGWALALGAAVGVGLAVATDLPWEATGRALPIAMLVALAVFGRRAAREGNARTHLVLLLGVYALAMLGKLGLHPQIQHYGFALAAPSLSLGVALALGACRSSAGAAIVTAAVVAVGASAWLDSNRIYSEKTFGLAGALEPGDHILVAGPETSPRGATVERALSQLAARLDPEQTLLVMPEGAGLNYWLRRRNPGPYGLFLPTELAAHGGAEAMLERMRPSPPDVVALVHRGHAEFGTGPFLADIANGAAFAGWLRREYRPISTIGAEPFKGPRFGIVLLEHIPGTTGP